MKRTTQIITLLVLLVTVASCGSGHEPEYHFVFPEVKVVLLDESPDKVVVEMWYEAGEDKKIFGQSEITGDKYIETSSAPATLRILERSIARHTRDPVTLVVVVRRGTDAREFRISGTPMPNGGPDPVEHSVRFN